MPWINLKRFKRVADTFGLTRIVSEMIDFAIETGVGLVELDPKKLAINNFLFEIPLNPSAEGKQVLIEAFQKLEETNDSSALLRTISEVSLKENLDPHRTASALFVCSYSTVKRYATRAYQVCVHLLGL